MKQIFRTWMPLSTLRSGGVRHADGVYAFRHRAGNFGRLVGSSDIVYIGETRDFNNRIFANYFGGQGGETVKRIHSYLKELRYVDRLEVSFFETPYHEKVEKELLDLYEKDHHEFPPWNRSKGRAGRGEV